MPPRGQEFSKERQALATLVLLSHCLGPSQLGTGKANLFSNQGTWATPIPKAGKPRNSPAPGVLWPPNHLSHHSLMALGPQPQGLSVQSVLNDSVALKIPAGHKPARLRTFQWLLAVLGKKSPSDEASSSATFSFSPPDCSPLSPSHLLLPQGLLLLLLQCNKSPPKFCGLKQPFPSPVGSVGQEVRRGTRGWLLSAS